MKDELRLLTCKAKGLGHQPTEVVIDWTDITQEQLMVLARHAIIHSLQCQWKKSQDAIPEKAIVLAYSFVHIVKEVLEDRPQLPKSRVDWLDALVKDLSEEDKARYLRELTE